MTRRRRPPARLPYAPTSERDLRAYVDRCCVYDPNTECVVWRGSVNRDGYGRCIDHHGRTWLAHRLVWHLSGRPLLPGMTLDHMCRNRLCVSTAHLDQVTPAENTRRMWMYRRPPERTTT